MGSVALTSTLDAASTVVSEFGGLVTLVVGLSVGVFVVGFLISKAKGAARR